MARPTAFGYYDIRLNAAQLRSAREQITNECAGCGMLTPVGASGLMTLFRDKAHAAYHGHRNHDADLVLASTYLTTAIELVKTLYPYNIGGDPSRRTFYIPNT